MAIVLWCDGCSRMAEGVGENANVNPTSISGDTNNERKDILVIVILKYELNFVFSCPICSESSG